MERQEFIDDLATQLRSWDSEIEELEGKLQRTSPSVATEYRQSLRDLKQKRRLAEDTLREVRDSDLGNWKEVAPDAEEALETIKHSFWETVSEVK